MTKAAELTGSIDSVTSLVADSRTTVGLAMEAARELAEQAAAHGWEAVASSMQEAEEKLECATATR